MLKPCNECGAEISVYAETCPKCGVRKPFKSSAARERDDRHKREFKRYLWISVKIALAITVLPFAGLAILIVAGLFTSC